MGKELKRLQGLTRISTSTDAESSDHKDKKPLQLSESELQNPETDVKEVKGFKRCSTATDAESSGHKDKKPLQIAESELQNPETDVKEVMRCSTDAEFSDHMDKEPLQIAESELENPETDVKKQKKRKRKSKSKEMKKLRKSFNEMTQTMRNLQIFFGSKSDPPGMSLKHLLVKMGPPPSTSSKKKEEAPKEVEAYECCFKTKDSDGVRESIFVQGFDTNLARDVIKSALRTYFESGGLRVKKVFVPIECKTGVSLGYAFVDVNDEQKALPLNGGLVIGRRLYVSMAEDHSESHQLSNFKGCGRCGLYLRKRRQQRFQDSFRRIKPKDCH